MQNDSCLGGSDWGRVGLDLLMFSFCFLNNARMHRVKHSNGITCALDLCRIGVGLGWIGLCFHMFSKLNETCVAWSTTMLPHRRMACVGLRSVLGRIGLIMTRTQSRTTTRSMQRKSAANSANVCGRWTRSLRLLCGYTHALKTPLHQIDGRNGCKAVMDGMVSSSALTRRLDPNI